VTPPLLQYIREAGISFYHDNLPGFPEVTAPDGIHLHGGGGASDDHLTPGRGTIDLAKANPRRPSHGMGMVGVPEIGWYDEGTVISG